MCQHELTCRAGKSILVKKKNSPHGGQVYYMDATAGTSNDHGLSGLEIFILHTYSIIVFFYNF